MTIAAGLAAFVHIAELGSAKKKGRGRIQPVGERLSSAPAPSSLYNIGPLMCSGRQAV